MSNAITHANLENCPFYITASSSSEKNPYLEAILKITTDFLEQKNIEHKKEFSQNQWRIEVKDLSMAMQLAGFLMTYHTYQHTRQKGVELFASPKSDDPAIRQHAIRIGDRPPTRNDLQGFEEVYLQQYLPDHSLNKTRLVHTIATVLGVGSATYGIFNNNWWFVLGGIAGIYEAGFHAHLFIEKNIPSSAKYPKQSVYSDLRVTLQMLLNPFTGGMKEDLRKAGIKDV